MDTDGSCVAFDPQRSNSQRPATIVQPPQESMASRPEMVKHLPLFSPNGWSVFFLTFGAPRTPFQTVELRQVFPMRWDQISDMLRVTHFLWLRELRILPLKMDNYAQKAYKYY